jgi:putative ABC transport system permease protein
VQDRVRELATLRALGYPGRALALALAQESLLLAAAGGLFGVVLARLFLGGATFGIAMGAFELEVGPREVLTAFGAALLVGLAASVPAAARALRLPVALAMKET